MAEISRPNLYRFFQDKGALHDGGRPLTDALVRFLNETIRIHAGNCQDLQYIVDGVLGAMSLGVLRWLNEPAITKDALVEELTNLVCGAFTASAVARGAILDPKGGPMGRSRSADR